MEKSKRIYWIDGLKGIACIMIFVHHFFVGFMPASYYGVGAMQHGNDGWEVLLSQNPASVLINGNFWVCVFCVLSGLVQGYKIFSMESLDRLPKDMVKRYFRLSLPVFFISLIVYLMMKGEVFFNIQANQIVQSPWLGTYYLEKKTLKDVFYTSFISVWFVGDFTFSNAFWMLKEIFVGSYLTYILSMIGHKKRKNVLVIYAGLGIIFLILQSYMLAFVAGVIIAYIMANTEKKLKYQPTIGGLEILVGCFFWWISNRGSTNKYLSFVQFSKLCHLAYIGSFFLGFGNISLQNRTKNIRYEKNLSIGRKLICNIPCTYSNFV